jgi:hypothetical protein
MDAVTHDAGRADDDRPITMADIGRALGITRQAVSDLAKRGMPTHSIEAAHDWRRRHLAPARRKRGAFDDEMKIRQAVDRANAVMRLAAQSLELDRVAAFPAMVQPLREALSAVPPDGRDRVMLSIEVMNELCRPVSELIDHCRAQDLAEARALGVADPDAEPRQLTADEAAEMGAFWYAVAAGERVLKPGPEFRP